MNIVELDKELEIATEVYQKAVEVYNTAKEKHKLETKKYRDAEEQSKKMHTSLGNHNYEETKQVLLKALNFIFNLDKSVRLSKYKKGTLLNVFSLSNDDELIKSIIIATTAETINKIEIHPDKDEVSNKSIGPIRLLSRRLSQPRIKQKIEQYIK